jgi:hypothetical protein
MRFDLEDEMSDQDQVDYGPLQALIGRWSGDRGKDLAPTPEGAEETAYAETLEFEAIGGPTNANEQSLAVLRYHQVVARKDDGEIFHDEIGYWMWDAKVGVVMQSLAIPRGVCLIASGSLSGTREETGALLLEVSTENKGGEIAQSNFMMEKARTTAFFHRITLADGKLHSFENTKLEIYGKSFDHTDENVLVKQDP